MVGQTRGSGHPMCGPCPGPGLDIIDIKDAALHEASRVAMVADEAG
jgi:hypothetical protein